MIAPVQISVRAQPATGQSFECWLNEELSATGTGGVALFTLTYSQANPGDPQSLPSLIAHRQNVTDPDAGLRFRQRELLTWMKDFRSLNRVAAMMFPGIRELTEPEQRSLRSFYRKLYRKA